jgi:hypothetical protein
VAQSRQPQVKERRNYKNRNKKRQRLLRENNPDSLCDSQNEFLWGKMKQGRGENPSRNASSSTKGAERHKKECVRREELVQRSEKKKETKGERQCPRRKARTRPDWTILISG